MPASFTCLHCRAPAPRWSAQCPHCKRWDALVIVDSDREPEAALAALADTQTSLTRLTDIKLARNPGLDLPPLTELCTTLPPGCALLMGGDPGAGKSTFALQLAGTVNGARIAAIFSAEETLEQIKMRADRIGVTNRNVMLTNENNAESVIEEMLSTRPLLTVIDSLQTLDAETYYESVYQIVHANKTIRGILLMIGQVNKDGEIAGPRSIEHLVDVIMYATKTDNENTSEITLQKNRFGPVNGKVTFTLT